MTISIVDFATLQTGPKPRSVAERFYEKVWPEPNSGCHLWGGTYLAHGYGTFRLGSQRDGSRRNVTAHRMAWELESGPIPDGLQVLHKCDNKACVNPIHLYLGTAADNARDASERGLLNNPARGKRGEANVKAKFSEAAVRAVRASDIPAPALARVYGVTPQSIYAIRKGRTWGHVA